jgi:hypothetical protein
MFLRNGIYLQVHTALLPRGHLQLYRRENLILFSVLIFKLVNFMRVPDASSINYAEI